jgi:hypothetical protein
MWLRQRRRLRPPIQIFDKYLTAIGGAARVAALTSYTAKGTLHGLRTMASRNPLEVYVKAPNQRLWRWNRGQGDHTMAFDGKDGWSARAAGRGAVPPMIPLAGQELDGTTSRSWS